MIYFDPSELAVSCIYAILFGISVAGIYASLYKISTYFILLLRLPIDALLARSGRVSVQCLKAKEPRGGLNREIFDFIFFTLTALCYILLLYVSLDGIPRIHFFILSLFGFLFSRATMGRLFTIVFDFILSRLYWLCFSLLYAILAPVRVLVRLLAKIYRPAAACIHAMSVSLRYKKLVRLKIRNTKKSMNKLYNPANIFF